MFVGSAGTAIVSITITTRVNCPVNLIMVNAPEFFLPPLYRKRLLYVVDGSHPGGPYTHPLPTPSLPGSRPHGRNIEYK
jgi:hypothetical protein